MKQLFHSYCRNFLSYTSGWQRILHWMFSILVQFMFVAICLCVKFCWFYDFSSFAFDFVSHNLQTNNKLNLNQRVNNLCMLLYDLWKIRIYQQLRWRYLNKNCFSCVLRHGWKFWNPFWYYFPVSKDELNSNRSNAGNISKITSFSMFVS